MRVSFRRIDSRETIQPWRGGKPETAENDAATLAAAARVEQMQLNGYSATEQQSQLRCHITEHGSVIFPQANLQWIKPSFNNNYGSRFVS